MDAVFIKKKVFIRALCWLLFLAPFFYLSYGFANRVTNLQPFVPEIYYEWEKSIPFLGWTIIPYWCLNLFYGLSLLVPKDKSGVDRLAARYLTAQLIAVTVFILFPLKATFVKPETVGFIGYLFTKLNAFDMPFNQAPSLHIALLTIVWDLWRKRIIQPYLSLWHVFCFLIALSVLTTYQHHFIDIPAGFLLGVFCLWLFPEQNDLPFKSFQVTTDIQGQIIALTYCFVGIICLMYSIVFFCHGIFFFFWPMFCFFCLASGYLGAGAKIFQKNENGTVSFASRVIFAPYRLVAFINSRIWTRKIDAYHLIKNNLYLGRFPSSKEAHHFDMIVDMTAEFRSYKKAKNWYSFPMLDLVTPDVKMLLKAEEIIEKNKGKKILVCCALGFQRSALVIVNYILQQKQAVDVNEAKDIIKKQRPIVIHDKDKNISFYQAAFYCFLHIFLAMNLLILVGSYVVFVSRFFSIVNTSVLIILAMISFYWFLLIMHLLFDAWLFWGQRKNKNIQEGLDAIDSFLLKCHLRKKMPFKNITVRINNINRLIKKLWLSISIVTLGICVIMLLVNVMDVI